MSWEKNRLEITVRAMDEAVRGLKLNNEQWKQRWEWHTNPEYAENHGGMQWYLVTAAEAAIKALCQKDVPTEWLEK